MPGRRWTREQWAAFQAELEELERTDPAVLRARERLDEAIWTIGHRSPPRRFLRRLGGRPEDTPAPVLSTGQPSTLGTWRDNCAALLGQDNPATVFFDRQIVGHARGRDEPVLAPEAQVMVLVAQLQGAST